MIIKLLVNLNYRLKNLQYLINDCIGLKISTERIERMKLRESRMIEAINYLEAKMLINRIQYEN